MTEKIKHAIDLLERERDELRGHEKCLKATLEKQQQAFEKTQSDRMDVELALGKLKEIVIPKRE